MRRAGRPRREDPRERPRVPSRTFSQTAPVEGTESSRPVRRSSPGLFCGALRTRKGSKGSLGKRPGTHEDRSSREKEGKRPAAQTRARRENRNEK